MTYSSLAYFMVFGTDLLFYCEKKATDLWSVAEVTGAEGAPTVEYRLSSGPHCLTNLQRDTYIRLLIQQK